MARKLRLLVPDGWYHVVNRGNRREDIFRTETDRRLFLARLAELPERFGLEIHAFVLMDNHYHLLVRTPEANLSDAIRWLQVSYASAFNRAHQVRGHLFQGRFHSVLIEERHGVMEVARYLHLNPVRIQGLGFEKAKARRGRVASSAEPSAAVAKGWLKVLNEYPWSSWRMYAGLEASPDWLTTGVITVSAGGRSVAERRAALREYTEAPIRQGRIESPWERVVGRLVLGSAEFAESVLTPRTPKAKAAQEASRLTRRARPEWAALVEATERLVGKRWSEMVEAHGDWSRDGVLYTAVRHLGYRLGEVCRNIPGLKYPAAAQAVKRFGQRLAEEEERSRFVGRLRRALQK